MRSGAVREVLPVDLPAIPGRDAVGVVDEVGEGVQGVGIATVSSGWAASPARQQSRPSSRPGPTRPPRGPTRRPPVPVWHP
ncbi:hypothetical protein NE234_15820 [Actinoallomurus sp. WRP9H-5]|nr:hypothetical protein [Actinoallomurus rhizosphaericola]MCO5994835.1 hypothetical protein [Actinoallomurus rhizosphaericola]